jgi:hypothetical protein
MQVQKMAKRTVIDCDRCGVECKDGHTHIDIPNGTKRYFDGVESNIDHLYEKKDLCPRCVELLLKFMFKHGRTQLGQEIQLFSMYQHPTAAGNDAIKLALKFFQIKEK